ATEAILGLLESRPETARSLLPRLESILSRSPRQATAQMAMAKAQRALGEIALAGDASRNAYRADRTIAPQVLKLCSEMIAADPKVAAPYLAIAEIYLADGEMVAAAEKLSQAASRTEGRQGEVVSLLEGIIAKDPGTARVSYLIAEVL